MEFLKCKSIIALFVMILSVCYISASDNVKYENQIQNNDYETVQLQVE